MVLCITSSPNSSQTGCCSKENLSTLSFSLVTSFGLFGLAIDAIGVIVSSYCDKNNPDTVEATKKAAFLMFAAGLSSLTISSVISFIATKTLPLPNTLTQNKMAVAIGLSMPVMHLAAGILMLSCTDQDHTIHIFAKSLFWTMIPLIIALSSSAVLVYLQDRIVKNVCNL